MTPKYYSQAGEDVILAMLLPGPVGLFAEIGCIDGLRFSNSYHFEQKGWRGLCVEAHTDYIPPLRINRPASVVVHAAVAETDAADVIFYANKRGSLSTLDPTKESEFRERFQPWFSGFTPQKVPLRSLSSIMVETGFSEFDFISIDVEGSELNVLRGLDLNQHRPRIMVIEADSPVELDALIAYLQPHRYRLLGSVSKNAFFAEEEYAPPTGFGLLPLRACLNQSPHPLDPQIEHCAEIEIDWQPAK